MEREIAQWLRENGYPSARRSQQFNGGEGLADIVADEPIIKDWHIESKGTKLASLKRSQLLDWYDQVERDCPSNMKAVVINQARGKPLVALIPFRTWKDLPLNGFRISQHVAINGSYPVYDSLLFYDRKHMIEAMLLGRADVGIIQTLVVEAAHLKIFICMFASDWLRLINPSASYSLPLAPAA